MPAKKGAARVHPAPEHALPTAEPVPVNNAISLSRYYLSADLLLRQAEAYRQVEDLRQRYQMLLRFASLVLETIPKHSSFPSGSRGALAGAKGGLPPKYVQLREALVHQHMSELEHLKLTLQLEPTGDEPAEPHSHPPDVFRVTTSNMPQLSNWALNMPKQSGAAAPPVPLQGWDLLTGDAQPAAISTPQPSAPFLPSSSYSNGYAEAAPASSLRLPIASQAALQRHALLPAPPSRPAPPRASAQPISYPSFDSTPVQPINRYMQQAPSAPSLLDEPQPLPSAPPEPPHPGLRFPDPHMELQLGPQEVEVVTSVPMATEAPAPGATCCPPPEAEAPVPPAGVEPPGDVAVVKKGVREVQLSEGLMNEFLRYAASNTQRNTESCGILAGHLDERKGVFQISTLIIPKQKGTSDTVEMLNEEDLVDAIITESLYPLGWIHTHPSQTCFLSSIDVHTQSGYQVMLEEAVAIVMAPRDRRQRMGIFRLSTPGGLELVQHCTARGFHAHPPTPTGQPLYEVCGHVYINPRLEVTVKDLR